MGWSPYQRLVSATKPSHQGAIPANSDISRVSGLDQSQRFRFRVGRFSAKFIKIARRNPWFDDLAGICGKLVLQIFFCHVRELGPSDATQTKKFKEIEVPKEAGTSIVAEVEKIVATRTSRAANPVRTDLSSEPVNWACPLCEGVAHSFLIVEDLGGRAWGLGTGCTCGPEAGGLILLDRFPNLTPGVRPGPPVLSFDLFQQVGDDRWEKIEQILRSHDVVTAEEVVERAISNCNETSPNSELLKNLEERIGGGLDEMSDAVLESPQFAAWEGRDTWRCLCVIDAAFASEDIMLNETFDNIAAVVSLTEKTGVWVAR